VAGAALITIEVVVPVEALIVVVESSERMLLNTLSISEEMEAKTEESVAVTLLRADNSDSTACWTSVGWFSKIEEMKLRI